MPLLRPARAVTRLTNRASATCQGPRLRLFSSAIRQESSQGYGDIKGDPKAQKPQQQGASSDTHHNAEHPGPAPPSEGQGTGGATKARSKAEQPGEARVNSEASGSGEAKKTGGSSTGADVEGRGDKLLRNKGVAKPKISEMKVPDEGDAEKQAEVEQHNKEFEQRYDRAPKAQDDKVDKKFWSAGS